MLALLVGYKSDHNLSADEVEDLLKRVHSSRGHASLPWFIPLLKTANGYQLKPTLNRYISHLRESGLFDQWTAEMFEEFDERIRIKKHEFAVTELSLQHVKGVLLCLT